MRTINDPTPINHREAYLPDLKVRGVLHHAATPGGCSCGKNYARPHYMPCVHVRLLRSGAPIGDLKLGALEDGTPAYLLKTVERFHSKPRFGYEPGMWEHSLCFDGRDFLVESNHLTTHRVRCVVVGKAWSGWQRRF